MAPDQDRFAALVATMNDVAVGYGAWADVLAPARDLLGVTLVTIDIVDKRTGEVRLLATDPIPPEEAETYNDHLAQRNPRYALVPPTPVGRIVTDRDIPPEIEAAGQDYYAWLGRASGTRYFAGVKLYDTPDFIGLCSINVPQRQGLVDAPTIGLYDRLIPHLANALLIDQALARRGEPAEALDGGALESGRAYAMLGADGRIAKCSVEFERLAESSGTLRISDRRLVARRPEHNRRLARLVDEARDPAPRLAPLPPARICSEECRQGLLVRAVRLNRSRELFARLRPVAMLVLVDLDAPSANIAEELRSGWGLTPREAELAMLIGQGHHVDQAAARLGISDQTARHHLKAIFRRLDIDRQTDLVRLVTRLGG